MRNGMMCYCDSNSTMPIPMTAQEYQIDAPVVVARERGRLVHPAYRLAELAESK